MPSSPKPLEPVQNTDPPESSMSGIANTSGTVHDISKANHSQLTDQTNLLPWKKLIVCFMGLSLCTLISQLDTVTVATALPTISSSFNAGSVISWVPSAYLLTSTGFVSLYGRFSDIFGRRATLTAALVIMMAGNLAAGFAKSVIHLIICRGIAGIGGGAIFSLAQIIMTDVVSLRDRGKYQAIVASISGIGTGVGPVIGGAFAQKVSWRWCFWFTVPIAFCALPVVNFVLPLKPVQGNVKQKLLVIDYVGAALTLVACTLIMLPLIWGGVTFPWGSPVIIATLIGGLATWSLFIIWEWKAAKLPIVPMYIFKYSTVCGAYICGAITGLIMLSVTFYLPQFYQVGLGYSPIRAATFLIPTLIGQTACNQAAGQLMSRTGHFRTLIYVGYALWSVVCGLISRMTPETPQSIMVVLMLFSGMGGGLTFQTLTVAAQASVPRKDMAVVTAFRNFIRMLGMALSLAIGSSILNNTLHDSMVQLSLPDDIIIAIVDNPALLSTSNFAGLSSETLRFILNNGFIKGFRRIFILNASLSAFAFITSVILVKHVELTRGDDEERQKEAQMKSSLEEKSGTSSNDDEKV